MIPLNKPSSSTFKGKLFKPVLFYLGFLASILASLSSYAEQAPIQTEQTQQGLIAIPVGQQQGYQQANELPARGLTRQQVLKRFGTPIFWQDDVGKPPITHWRYAAYSVYFESNRVIHTVIHNKKNEHIEK